MLDNLINKILEYNPNADVDRIKKAYYLAEDLHKGQMRNSGEEYITHPYNVALILTEMNMDTDTIVAALLHDTIEDTGITFEEVEDLFDTEIANLVDGVTKLKKLNYQTKEEKQAENIRKMVLAMAKDIRVVIIKFADRLHNMRTLEYMTPEKKKEKALETIEIYAPLADRLGMSRMKWELEDLSLRYLDPEKYDKLTEMVRKRRSERESIIDELINTISVQLKKAGIVAEIQGRPKNFYSIYKKMEHKGRAFEAIYDLSAVRILVDDIKDCYGALGVVHTMYKPIPGRFKDYISMPKPNKYQSLHTTVIDNNGETFEVQIRTWEMHRTAEYGIAAHWKYKQGSSKGTSFDENLTWLRQLLEWQKDLNDPNEFMETLKVDFFADEVFVFTPHGDVINLPEGSTPIDFAYRIHTAVGNACVGAKVNGRIVPLDYSLENGNIVEVITNKNSGPSTDWLGIVKSSQAKTKIRQYFKVKDRDKNIVRGKEMIEEEAKRLGYPPNELFREEWLEQIQKKLSSNTIDDVFAGVGYGSFTVNQVLTRLTEFYREEMKIKDPPLKAEDIETTARPRRSSSNHGIHVKGIDNVKVRFAKCCNPVPGDQIIGYITMGRGVSVHRVDCLNVDRNHEERLIDVAWDIAQDEDFNAEIEIIAADKGNVLGDIASRINSAHLGLVSLTAKTTKDHTLIINTVIQIKNKQELKNIMKKLQRIDNVYEVYRVKN